ncbi:EAL domain-containing protein [Microcoleus sp. A003_D6]|uniref:EAL domain-containing protein n=1 Tax=Microcoleus sp. A003_D6 TaxID=3055266 RepID=UPI002FD3D755
MQRSGKAFGSCSRCETVPAKEENSGGLYLWFPVSHTLTKVISALTKAEFELRLLEESKCLYIIIEGIAKEKFNALASSVLTTQELKETKVLWMREAEQPKLSDFYRSTSLDYFINLSNSDWLLDLLSEERITTHFQPIVYTSDTSKIFAHEALLRGIDEQGNLIYPGRIFAQAESAGLIFQLDVLARTRAIREAHVYDIKELLFINFSPTSVYDPATCLRRTVQAIDESGIPHSNIVFEVGESQHPPDMDHLIKILRFYREAGFLIALDDFGSGSSNLNLMHQLRPDFIKLDMELIRNVHQDYYKALITEKMLEIAAQLEIKTIAEGVETLEELEWVRQRGATFVQGYLIAKPTSPPIAVTSYIGGVEVVPMSA